MSISNKKYKRADEISTQIEAQFASSILYYDKDELNKFLKEYEPIQTDDNIIVDGRFDLFIKYIKKFKDFNDEDDADTRRASYINFINMRNSNNPDKNKREEFSFWFNAVLDIDIDLELAEDIRDHFCWDAIMNFYKAVDESNIPFSEKITSRPKFNFNSREDEILTFDKIKPEREDSTSYTTGLEGLDRGVEWKRGYFVVIAARPSVGKSLMLFQSAIENSRMKGAKVLYISLEMPRSDMNDRLLNYLAGYNVKEACKNEYDELNYDEYVNKNDEIKAARTSKFIMTNLHIDCMNIKNADAILDIIEKHIDSEHYDIIYIDYLQLLMYPGKDIWGSIRQTSKDLKSLALRKNVLVVTASQVSRSSTEDGLDLTDLFGSSTIEADADIVIGLENPGQRKQGDKSIIIVKTMKQRQGALMEVKCQVDYSIGKMECMNY